VPFTPRAFLLHKYSIGAFTTGQAPSQNPGIGKDLPMNFLSRSKVFQVCATALISLSMSVTLLPSAHADSYNPLNTVIGKDNILNYVVENGSMERNSYLAIMPPAVTSASETRSDKWQWCVGLDDPICDPKNNPANLKATSILGPCLLATEENCIDSLEIGIGDKLEKATLIRVTDGLTFPADSRYNYPGSSNISLWKTPSLSLSFAVMPRMQLYFRNGGFDVGDLFTDVIPYKEKTGDYSQIRINESPDATPNNRYKFTPNSQLCVFEQDGICGVAQDFESNTRIRIKLRVSKIVGGWFQGRLNDPVLDVSSFSAKNNLLTVEASPVTVPRMALVVTPAEFTDQEKIWRVNFGGGLYSGPQAGNPKDSFPFLDFYRARVKDTTVGLNTFWNFSTTSWGEGSQCLQDKSKVLGIVSTNALAYDGQSPSFIDGSLNYRVSGLHLMPDGVTPVLGSYNLVMRSEVARCLYGFTNAPIQATVSIIGGENASVATTVLGERNGWLSMAAGGFTFSTKTIQVKLSQEKAVVVPPAQKIVKKTIKCVKGKTVKKVTAAKPKCPSGYKLSK
jgi:hypothetical protein